MILILEVFHLKERQLQSLVLLTFVLSAFVKRPAVSLTTKYIHTCISRTARSNSMMAKLTTLYCKLILTFSGISMPGQRSTEYEPHAPRSFHVVLDHDHSVRHKLTIAMFKRMGAPNQSV